MSQPPQEPRPEMIAVDLSSEADVAHHAFNLALVSDESLIFFRRMGALRWEASRWSAERVTTSAATYTYAKLEKISYGTFRWSARRGLDRSSL